MDTSNGNGTDLTLAVDSSNKQPVQSSFTMLPPEILCLVCGFLHKPVLKKVRQVSKIWERAAVPYLFDEIFISQDSADFLIAKLVVRQFQHYVRTLVVSSIYYENVERGSFEMDFIDYLDLDIKSDTDIYHCDHAFGLYRTARKKQQKVIADGSSSAYLSFALASLPNIRKIILTDGPSSRSMPNQSLQTYQPRKSKACPFEQCDLTAAEHIPHELRWSGFSRKGSTNPWRLVLSALSATNVNVKELTMEPASIELSTHTAAFSMSPKDLPQAILAFHKLTKLRLCLFVDIERYSSNVEKRYIHRNVQKLLCSATNLESLSIDLDLERVGDEERGPTLRNVLGQCKLPKLRSLILAFFESSEEELLQLLSYANCLEQITIDCHTLTQGSWMHVADWIRVSLPLLKHAELNQLYGGFDKPFMDFEFFDHYGDVGNFLFAKGENPFTTKALEKYIVDSRSERQKTDVFGGLGYLEAYTRYF